MRGTLTLLAVTTAIVCGASGRAEGQEFAPLERGLQNGRFVDEYFGIVYEVEGLEEGVPSGAPLLLFAGRLPDGVEVEIGVQEAQRSESAAEWLAGAKRIWDRSGSPRTEVTEGVVPQPWIVYRQEDPDGVDRRHGYAFHARDLQCFIVHARARGDSAVSAEALRELVNSLVVKEAPGSFAVAHLVAREAREDPRSATVLARAAGGYFRPGPLENFELARRTGELALARAEKGTFDDSELWQIHYIVATAQLKTGRLEEAVGSWKRALRLAKQASDPEYAASNSRYNLACTYAVLGRKDDAFRELEAALAVGSERQVASLRELAARDSDLESLHGDARWAKLFGASGAD